MFMAVSKTETIIAGHGDLPGLGSSQCLGALKTEQGTVGGESQYRGVGNPFATRCLGNFL